MLEYLTTFLVGIASFLSPCMLPMLPIYFSYFAGEGKQKSRTFLGALCFAAGFSAVFCTLGLFAGSFGALLNRFHEWVEIAGGILVVLLGFNLLGILKLPHWKGFHSSHQVTGLVSSFVFGVIFSVSHIPCVGALLGTALATAGISGSVGKGVLLLLFYSLGMGVPFLISALLLDQLNPLFETVKKNYTVVNRIFGILLILLGICMATGLLHHLFHAA